MHHLPFKVVLFLVGTVGTVMSATPAQTAVITNAGFDTYIAATDSFAGWSFKKDTSKYLITQEKDSAHTPPGALKIQNKDTSASAAISATITGLAPKKIFTVTAWVKYADMPAYYNAMFNLQQATLLPPDWAWVDRKWLTPWGNRPGTSDWIPITMSDTTADSANIFNLVISSSKGSFWVDDIAVTYRDPELAVKRALTPNKQNSISNTGFVFSRQMPYIVEVCSIDGKTAVRKTGIAASFDLNSCTLTNGIYLVRVKTSEKTYTSRIVVSK